MSLRPAVKICGLTNEADAFAAAQAGVSYLGYILYSPSSPRAITTQTASAIMQHIRQVYPHIQHVGVFVNAPEAVIKEIDSVLQLDVMQFHGDETVAMITSLPQKKIWKSIIVRDQDDLQKIALYEPYVQAIHLDAGRGSGQMIDRQLLDQIHTTKPLVIAGGISPANVTEFLQYQPAVIDVSSGVEKVLGKKDIRLIKQLIQNCYAATS